MKKCSDVCGWLAAALRESLEPMLHDKLVSIGPTDDTGRAEV